MTDIRNLGGWHRKATSWQEVGLPIPLELLEDLPQYTSEELGVNYNMAADFKVPVDAGVFLLGHAGGVYLVNTEGSNYARYIRYIGGFPKDVEITDDGTTIEIVKVRDKFYWLFANIDLLSQDLIGPFDSRELAVQDAHEFIHDIEASVDSDDGPDLSNAILFADDHHGIYIPQYFAQQINHEFVTGVSDEEWTILEAGPDHDLYWETWEQVAAYSNVIITMPDSGIKYYLCQIGDLWLIPIKSETGT